MLHYVSNRPAVNKITSAPGRGTFWADVGLRINCVTLLCIYLWDAWRASQTAQVSSRVSVMQSRWNIHEPPAMYRAAPAWHMPVPSINISHYYSPRYTQANDRVIRHASVNKIHPDDIDRNWQIYSARVGPPCNARDRPQARERRIYRSSAISFPPATKNLRVWRTVSPTSKSGFQSSISSFTLPVSKERQRFDSSTWSST